MWLAIGGIAVRLIEVAVQAVERSETAQKGEGKTTQALNLINDLMGSGAVCGDVAANLPKTQDAEDAYNDYIKAYVRLQNVIAAGKVSRSPMT